jgi:hypothetical protein
MKRALLLLLLSGLIPAAMGADTPFTTFITSAPTASAPAGTEKIPIIQGAVTKSITPAGLTTYVNANLPALSGDCSTPGGGSGVLTCGSNIARTGVDVNTSNQVTATHLATALPIAQGGTGAATGSANLVFATPNGSSGAPSFRALGLADILTCSTTQIVFDSAGTLVCSANFTWNDSTTTLNVGALTLTPSAMQASATFQFGIATPGTGSGLTVTVAGSNGASTGTTTGGAAVVQGGSGGTTAGNGGPVTVKGGSSPTNGSGGAANLSGGGSSTGATGSGGGVNINGANAFGTTTGSGGAVAATAGNGSSSATTTANGGAVTITAGTAGNTATTTANGGSVTITAGNAGTAAATANGGNITIKPGTAPTQANAGQIFLQSQGGTNTLIIDEFGNVICTCVTTTAATDGFTYLGAVSGLPTGIPAHTTGTYANSIPVRYDSTNSNLWAYNGAWVSAVQAPSQLSYQPGLITTIVNTKSVYSKIAKASTVDNIEGSAQSLTTCTTNPTVTFFECGTSATCASPVTIGSVTITAAGQAFDGTVSAAAITAGDYVGWAITAGACASLDLGATAQIHAN